METRNTWATRWPSGSGRDEILGLLAFAAQEVRGIALLGAGHQPRDQVEQLVQPGAGARRRETDRDQVTFAQRFLEGRVQLLWRERFALLQVDRHQRFVELDDLVDQRFMGRAHRRKSGRRLRVRREEAVHDA